VPTTIKLKADARYGYQGKQYIARITGRDPKMTFAREFVGQKGGKRGDVTEYLTDEVGLYVTCDIDSKGRKDETYILIESTGKGEDLTDSTCEKDQAMRVAKYMDEGSTFEQAVLKVFPPAEPVEIDPTPTIVNAPKVEVEPETFPLGGDEEDEALNALGLVKVPQKATKTAAAPKPPKAAKAQAVPKEGKKLSALDAALVVLRQQDIPMTAKELVAAMKEQGLWESPGATPDATLSAAIYTEIKKKGKNARFTRPEPGKFAAKGV
jgi:hypothetical protein